MFALFFLIALVVRGAHFLAIRDLEFFGVLGLDAQFYHDWAASLAQGNGSLDEPFFLGPLYPYFLSLAYRLGGTSPAVAMTVQLGLGCLTASLVYLTTTRVFDRTVGSVASLLFLSYGYLIFVEFHLISASLLTFLVAFTAFWVAGCRADRPWRWWLAGVGIGLLCLGRGTFLLALAAALIVWMWRAPSRPRALRQAGWLLLATAMVIAPVTIRNYRAGGEFVLITTNGGINYAIGNHPDAAGVFDPIEGVAFFHPASGHDGGSRSLAEQRSSQTLTPAEASSYWLQEGLRWNRENPGRTVSLWGKKLLMALSAYEIPQIENFGWARDDSPLLRLNPIQFGTLSALGLVGLVWGGRTRGSALALMCLSYLAALLPFFITARYRVVLVPLLACFAGFALVSLWRAMKSRAGPTLLRAGSAAVVLLVLVQLYRPAGIAAVSDQLRSYSRGVVAMQNGDFQTAITQLSLAAREDPTHAPTLSNLGLALHQVGRTDEAVRMLDASLVVAPEDPNILVPFAEILQKTRRFDRAEEVLLTLHRLDPTDPYTLAQLGEVMLSLDRREDAASYFRQVLDHSDRAELRAHVEGRLQELPGLSP